VSPEPVLNDAPDPDPEVREIAVKFRELSNVTLPLAL
jgi:hypothetical protein